MQRISLDYGWHEPNGDCWEPVISGNGRYVAFTTEASNLLTNDPGAPDENGVADIYLRDRIEPGSGGPLLYRVSISSGEASNGPSGEPALDGEGEHLAFASEAANLVSDDTNGVKDVFLRDQVTGAVVRVSVSSAGEQGNGPSGRPAISAEGQWVAFESEASNLVAGDANGVEDVFLHDVETGVTTRVSVSAAGGEGNGASSQPVVSSSGRYVAYLSEADNLVAGDSNGARDVFVYDGETGEAQRVSVSSTGEQGDGDCTGPLGISGDGRLISFTSSASNLGDDDTNGETDVFLHDRTTGETRRMSVGEEGGEGNGASAGASLSADGWCLAFQSLATNLVEDDTNGYSDIFVRDRATDFCDLAGSHWAYDYVQACALAGIVGGYGDGSYRPDLTVTRGQMAVYISRALAGGDAYVPTGPAVATFPDVPIGYWAFKYVEYCHDQGVVGGYADGYRPEDIVNRAQMAVYVSRAMAGGDGNVPDDPDGTPFFPDVPSGYWAYKYVEYCHDSGVVGGYWDGYHPEETVNRAQMAVYVQRAFALPM